MGDQFRKMMIAMMLQSARNLLVPALAKYAADTETKIDDYVVNRLADALNDPLLEEILLKSN